MDIEALRTLRAIRRLSSGFPAATAPDRLKTIEGLASGKVKSEDVRRKPSKGLFQRVKDAQGSRSRRTAFDLRDEQPKPEPEDEKKRKSRGSRDRAEKGGRDRSEG